MQSNVNESGVFGNCPFWQFRSKRLQDEFKGMNTRAMNQRAAWLEWAAMAPAIKVEWASR
jgi:hypothetical protein